MNKILGLAAGAAFAIAALDAHAADAALRNDIAADYRERLAALFDHFHRNPELSGLEVETSKRLAAELRALGYEVTEGVGGTGVVAVMRNGAGPDRPAARRHGRPARRGEERLAERVDRAAGRHHGHRATRHARVRSRRAHDGARRHGAPTRGAQDRRGPARSC